MTAIARWKLPVIFSLTTLAALGLALQRPDAMRFALTGLSLAGAALSGLRARSARPAPVKASWRQRASFSLLLALTLASAATVGITYAAANQLAHPNRNAPDCQLAAYGITAYEPVSFATSDGLTLRGWYLPSHNGAAVIFAHGFSRNRCRLAAEAAVLVKLGYGALLYDARNAGESDGSLTTLGALEMNDVLGAVRYLRSRPDGANLRLGAYGHSMGGASVARAAAASPDILAVAIASSFSSMRANLAASVTGLTGLPAFPFAPLVGFFGQMQTGVRLDDVRPEDSLRALGARPALILHGAADNLLSPDNARRLYAAASGPRQLLIVPGMSHWCCLLPPGEDQPDRAALERTLADFWTQALPPATASR